ncbi:MAG: hypothetical protein Q4P36_04905 [Bowdeniella nasicola]|nr:hypothetical protein [Bowdeniella nasicola]
MPRRPLTTTMLGALLLLSACTSAPVAEEGEPSSTPVSTTPSVEESEPTGLGDAREGWRWESQRGLAFQVPEAWGVGFPPASDWCVEGAEVPDGTPLVVPPVSQAILEIACGPMPEEFRVAHVGVNYLPDPDVDVLAALSADAWTETEGGNVERLEAEQMEGALEGSTQEIAETYVRYTRKVGPLILAVNMPPSSDDEDLAREILSTVRPVDVSAEGCPTVAQPGPSGPPIGQTHDVEVAICQYRVPEQSGSEAGEADSGLGIVLGAETLEGQAAQKWLDAFRAAGEGTGPNSEACGGDDDETEFVQVRAGQSVAHVTYDGCTRNGITDSEVTKQLTVENCGPLFGKDRVRMMMADSSVADVCMGMQ